MPFKVIPEGDERKVEVVNTSAIDGAPIAYIVVLAAIVTALSFIPFSIILGSGGAMPLSQAVFPLMGWLLGPIAGATASGIGTLVASFLSPLTVGNPVLSLVGPTVGSFLAGTMVVGKKRRGWWLGLSIILLIPFFLYSHRAIGQNGIPTNIFIAGTLIEWSGFLLFILPTRILFTRWITSSNLQLVALGLFGGTWMISGLSHLCAATLSYSIIGWPLAIWNMLIPVIPFENLIRSTVGMVIGVGVIAGLRAIGLVKSREAIY